MPTVYILYTRTLVSLSRLNH